MKTVSNLLEDLRQWFDPKHPKGGWKRINSKGEAIGPCAREPGEAKPKCMSNEKRAKLSKKERASAVAAKRRNDPNPERKGKPINVSNFGKGKISEACWDRYVQRGMKKKGNRMVPNCVPEEVEMQEANAAAIAAATAIAKKKSGNYDSEGLRKTPYKNPDAPNRKSNAERKKEMNEDYLEEKNVPTSPEKWAQAKAQAKAKFDVYPSAYANGWAAKKYKEMGGGWKSVSEGAVPSNEKIITVKHKTSGKTLRISANAAAKYRTMGYHYHPTNEEVESIEELSNETLKSYLKTSKSQEDTGLGRQGAGAKHQHSYETSQEGKRGAIRRLQARNNQIGKYGEVPKVPGYNKEEVEQVNEISDTTAANYVRKRSVGYAKKMTPDSNGNVQPADVLDKMSDKHKAGISRAMDRLVKPVKEDNKPEVDTPAKESLTKRSEKPTAYVHEGRMKDIVTNRQEDERLKRGAWSVEGEWKKSPGTVTDKSGAKHTPMSRARDLARQAAKRKMQEQSNIKPNPFTVPSINPGQSPDKKKSRQSSIIREAMKAGKEKKKQKEESDGTADKFIQDPELSSKITKS